MIENDLKALCSKLVEDPINILKTLNSNLNTQVSNLKSEKNDLNQELMKEKKNVKDTETKLQLEITKRVKMEIDYKTTADSLEKLKNENLNLIKSLQNQNQAFKQETSLLKENHSKVVDEMKKSSEVVKKQLNDLQLTHDQLKIDSNREKIKLKDENTKLLQNLTVANNQLKNEKILLLNENLDLITKLQNQNQTFKQETSQLKEKLSKDFDEIKKSSEDVKKQLNALQLTHDQLVQTLNHEKIELMNENTNLLQNLVEANNQLKDEKILLQNQNQTFNQGISQLKQNHSNVVDGLKKSSENLQQKFNKLQQTHDKLKTDSNNLKNKNNNLTQEVSNQKNNITQMIKEIVDIKLNLTTAEKLNSSCNKTESIILMNDNKILNTTLHNIQQYRKDENQTYQNTIQRLKNDSINNMTLLNTEIESLKIKFQSQLTATTTPAVEESKSDIASKFHVIFSYVKNHRDETLLLCSGCFNIFLIILLILLIRIASKKSTIENKIENTIVLTGNRTSTN
ncbi:unnamed protein product [Diamesa tonsa]